MDRWWERVFAEDERAAYATMRKGATLPRGQRPVLLVIDVTRAFCGERGQTLEEAQRVWPTACGPVAWEAMPYLAALIGAARAHRVPLVYTTGQPGADRLFGGTVKGEDGPMGSPMAWPGAQEIPAEIAPRDGELVLAKPKASAFFATPLLALLHRLAADSLIVCGTTTSGCVRATVVDGFSWGYPVFVAEEATFDRSRLSHAINLFEMNAKYADVLTVAEIMEWMRRCRNASQSAISTT